MRTSSTKSQAQLERGCTRQSIPLEPAPDMNTPIDRREFVHRSAALGALTLVRARTGVQPARQTTTPATQFALDEVTIAQLQDGMASGKYTSHAITELY